MSQPFVFGKSDNMEVENNEDAFLEDSADSDDSQTQTQTQTKETKPKKSDLTKWMVLKNQNRRFAGKSATIHIFPIPREFTASQIYEWIQSLTTKTAKSIILTNSQQRDTDAQIAYITFAAIADASDCAPKIDQQLIPNTDIPCQCSVTAPTKRSKKGLRGGTACFLMSGLSKSTTEQDILSHIQQKSGIANKPKTIRLIQHQKDNYTGRAFVECANSEDATKCVENLLLTTLCGSKVWCDWRPPLRKLNRKEKLAGKTSSLLVVNLHSSLKSADVVRLCEKYGEVMDVDLWVDRSGYPKGSAQVRMETVDEAQDAFEGLHGEKVKGLSLDTAYFLATSKEIEKRKNRQKKQKELKKVLIKSKTIQKKKGKGKGKRHGSKSVLKKDSNTSIALTKKTARGRGKGKGRRRGPKMAGWL